MSRMAIMGWRGRIKASISESFRPAEREDTSNTLGTTTVSDYLQDQLRPLSSFECHADKTHHIGILLVLVMREAFWDEGDTTLVTAAKVIKTAMLHDARNIEGNNAGSRLWHGMSILNTRPA